MVCNRTVGAAVDADVPLIEMGSMLAWRRWATPSATGDCRRQREASKREL